MNKYEIRDKAKLYTKYVMRIILKFFWVFPIKQRTIFLWLIWERDIYVILNTFLKV